MNRIFLATALLLGGSTLGIVGCDQTTKTEDVKKVNGPNGSAEVKTTTEEKKTGDMKDPAPATPSTTEAPK